MNTFFITYMSKEETSKQDHELTQNILKKICQPNGINSSFGWFIKSDNTAKELRNQIKSALLAIRNQFNSINNIGVYVHKTFEYAILNDNKISNWLSED